MRARKSVVFTVFVFCLAVISPSASAQVAQPSSKVVLDSFKGEVQVIKAGETQGRPAKKGEILSPKDRVQIGKEGSAKIVIGEQTVEDRQQIPQKDTEHQIQSTLLQSPAFVFHVPQ